MQNYCREEYDVIVVGAGHAGCEAALASARMGMKTAVFTITLDNIALMSCNPSIGGPGKSHIVKEIDALGGEMGRNIDKTFVQIRVLNTKKGPAVRAIRAQADKKQYHIEMKSLMENTENLDVIQGLVTDILVENGRVIGINTKTGMKYKSKSVVIATGTFMRGLIHVGDKTFRGGRMGELPSDELPESLERIGLMLGRFKTGTPPRIDARTIDYKKVEEQPGEKDIALKFSSLTKDNEVLSRNQLSCYITHTNIATHKVVLENLDRAPLFNGSIKGTGPRYCPSVEDKIVRYQEKERHPIFLEPEGYTTNEIYINGMSTSLPTDIQYSMLNKIDGLENAKIMRFGYAIEYDYVLPEEIDFTLQTKKIENLFLAGQINGTSGYEEAAGQGLLAGMNAALKVQNKKPVVLDRADSYIGIMIDDLVTKGTNEPYRMFTARSEYRLALREDNADIRLSKIGFEAGLLSLERYNNVIYKEKKTKEIIDILRKRTTGPANKKTEEVLLKRNEKLLISGTTLIEILRRPEVTYQDIKYIAEDLEELDSEIEYQIEIQVKYEGYIEKQLRLVEKHKQLENRKIPEDFPYDDIKTFANEAKQKFKKIRPMNIGQASRIEGISPADISILIMHLEMLSKKNQVKD